MSFYGDDKLILEEILSIDPIGVRWKKQNIKKYTQTFTVETYVKVEGWTKRHSILTKMEDRHIGYCKNNIGKITEGEPIIEEVEMKDVPKKLLGYWNTFSQLDYDN